MQDKGLDNVGRTDDFDGIIVTVNASDSETVHDHDPAHSDTHMENPNSPSNLDGNEASDFDFEDLDPDSPLMKAMEKYNEDEIKDFMEGSGVDITPKFSDGFEARIQELTGQSKPSAFEEKPHKKKRGAVVSFFAFSRARRVAAVVLIIIAFAGATVSVDAVKIPIKKFFKEIQVQYARVSAVEKETVESDQYEYPTIIEKKFKLGYILPGYECKDTSDIVKRIVYTYSNQNDDSYLFSQATRDFQMYGNNEYNSYEEINIHWGKAIYYDMDNYYSLVWYYDDYLFSITGNLSKEQMEELAESLILDD